MTFEERFYTEYPSEDEELCRQVWKAAQDALRQELATKDSDNA